MNEPMTLAPWLEQVVYDDFVETMDVPLTLFKGMLKYLGGWTEFCRIALGVVEHGPDAGWQGMYYEPRSRYYSAVEYYKEYSDMLLSYSLDVANDADELWAEWVAQMRWNAVKDYRAIYLVGFEHATIDVQYVQAALSYWVLYRLAHHYKHLTIKGIL